MKATTLIFRRLSQADFKNISGQGGVEGGGGQGYIDISTKRVSKDMMYDFLGKETIMGTKGPRWEFNIKSLSINEDGQTIAIYQRRESSFCIASQKIGTRESNRVNVWKTELTGFPDTAYDETNNPLIVYIIKDENGIYWAGWYFINKYDTSWYMNVELAAMFYYDCGYIKFSVPIPFDQNIYTWPFLEKDKITVNNKDMKNQPLQQIYYGAPGTGKSHKTDEIASKYPETVRTTFHPDSDYSTFVGAYKPTMSKERKSIVIGEEEKPVKPMADSSEFVEKIAYKFVKQAFLKAYVKAWNLFKNAKEEDGKWVIDPQFLVIEEINRGNCAQIFGDLFQLLDRKQNFSEYPIEADDDIRKSLLEPNTQEDPSFGEQGLLLTPEQKAYINQVFDKEGEPSREIAEKICNGQLLVLPPNLYIWATMNTSDQSLFPIDSAFKRRWEWKYVRINEGKDKNKQSLNFRIKFNVSATEQVDESWWEFIQKINEKIEDATKSEDKKLGYFFCKPDKKANETDEKNTIISAELFVGKVVFYLWQDVFKDYGFKSDIFKKEDNKRLAFHDFYPHDIEPDEENPEGINLKLVKKFIYKVMGKAQIELPTETLAPQVTE